MFAAKKRLESNRAIPGMKPGQPERNRATTGVKPSRLGKQSRKHFWSLQGHYKVTTFRFSFMNGSNFEPTLGSFWSCVRGCIPDSVSNLFHEWLKFRADTRIILVAYAAWLHSRFGVSLRHLVSRMAQVSSRHSNHFGRVCCVVACLCCVVAFQIRFRYVSNLVS